MNSSLLTIYYGARPICFELIVSRRRTMQIAVLPEGKVVVRAPEGVSVADVKNRIARRGRWISQKIEYFQRFEPRTPPRRYVSGETHLYLGRRYRLKVAAGKVSAVKMKRGQLQVVVADRSDAVAVKRQVDYWIAEKATHHFPASFERCWLPFERRGLHRPSLKIRTMKTRWGSLSSRGTMTLNRALMHAPRECIDYVMMHELCHLVYRNHSPGFYRLLQQVMPEWRTYKSKLEACLR